MLSSIVQLLDYKPHLIEYVEIGRHGVCGSLFYSYFVCEKKPSAIFSLKDYL